MYFPVIASLSIASVKPNIAAGSLTSSENGVKPCGIFGTLWPFMANKARRLSTVATGSEGRLGVKEEVESGWSGGRPRLQRGRQDSFFRDFVRWDGVSVEAC